LIVQSVVAGENCDHWMIGCRNHSSRTAGWPVENVVFISSEGAGRHCGKHLNLDTRDHLPTMGNT